MYFKPSIRPDWAFKAIALCTIVGTSSVLTPLSQSFLRHRSAIDERRRTPPENTGLKCEPFISLAYRRQSRYG